MAQLTIDQLAKRATKKRNNRTAREVPLLAFADAIPNDWLTTEEKQKERIERQHKRFEAWWEEFQQSEQERTQLAERYKAECRELVDDEAKFSELVRGAQHIAHNSPVYALDYWHTQAARLDPRLCPHYKEDHWLSKALGHDKCPVCLVEGLLNER